MSDYNLLAEWGIAVKSHSGSTKPATNTMDRDNYKIIHPKEPPPRTVASIYVEKCSVQPSLLPGVPKQLSFELKSPMCPPSRPRYRRAGMCKRQDTIKGILEHDTSYQTKHHTLLHTVPKFHEQSNARESLRIVRDRTLNENTTHLAERLLVEDTTFVLKKKSAHCPPWTKENLHEYFDIDKQHAKQQAKPSEANSGSKAKQLTTSRSFGEFKRRFQVQPFNLTNAALSKTKLIVQSSRAKAQELD